jgi:TP901 family phage tail tape measure protein
MAASGNPLASLIIKFIADASPFVSGVKEMQDTTEKAASKIAEVGKTIATALPFAALSGEAFHAAEEFENATAKIARVTGATGDSLRELQRSFKELFTDTTVPAEQLADALGVLARETRLTGDPLETLTRVNAQLAHVTGAELVPQIEATQNAFKQFGVTADQQPAKLDALFSLTQKTGISIGALAGQLQSAGPVLKTLGLNFSQSAALIASFEEHGISADRVVAALNKGLVTLGSEGIKNPEQAMAAFIKRLTDAKTPLEAVNIATETFGKRAGLFFADAARQGAFQIGELTKAADESGGLISQTAKDTETLGDKLTKLGHEASAALAPLGAPLVEDFTKLIEVTRSAVEAFSQLPKPLQDISIALLAVGAAGPVALKAIKLFAEAIEALKVAEVVGVLGTLSGVIKNISFAVSNDLTGALTGFEAVLLGIGRALPFAALAAAIAIPLQKLVEFGEKSNNVKTSTDRATEALHNQIKGAEGLKDPLKNLIGVVGDFAAAQDKAHAKPFTLIDPKAAEELKKAFSLLGIKDVEKDISDLQKAFALVKSSGSLTGVALTDAFDALQLKIADIRASVGDDPFKALGVQTEAQLKIASQALEQIRARYIATGQGANDLTAAQDAYSKKVDEFNKHLLPLFLTSHAQLSAQFIQVALDEQQAAQSLQDFNERIAVGPDKVTLEFQTLGDAIRRTVALSADAQGSLSALGVTSEKALAEAVDKAFDLYNKIVALGRIGLASGNDMATGFHQANAQLIKLLDAGPFEALGIHSQAALERLRDEAKKNYEQISNYGQIASLDSERSWVAYIDKAIAAGDQLDAATRNQYERIKAQVSGAAQAINSTWKQVGQSVNRVVDDLSRGIAQAIVQAQSLADVFKKVAQDIAADILEIIIKKGLKALLDELSSVQGAIGKIATSLGGLASKGASGIGVPATPTTFPGGGIPGVSGGSSGAGGVAGAAGQAAGIGISAVAGIVTGAISAVTGVISVFQNAHQETSLNAIEEWTRRTANATERGHDLTQDIDNYLSDFKNIFYGVFHVDLVNISSTLDNIRAVLPKLSGGNGGGTSVYGGTQNTTINWSGDIIVQGAGDPQSVARQIPDLLRSLSTRFAIPATR